MALWWTAWWTAAIAVLVAAALTLAGCDGIRTESHGYGSDYHPGDTGSVSVIPADHDPAPPAVA
jgi:hypothetical protein